MVLRKKDDHISFLHVYHHTGMCALAWGGAKYLPGATIIRFFSIFFLRTRLYVPLLLFYDCSKLKNILVYFTPRYTIHNYGLPAKIDSPDTF